VAETCEILATRANVAGPAGQQSHVPAVLKSGVEGPPIGLELREESLEGFRDRQLGEFPWKVGLECSAALAGVTTK
jgi:hypothetical protein